MRSSLPVTALAALLLIGGAQAARAHDPAIAATSPASPLAGDAANAAKVVDRFHAALAAGDTSGAAALMSDQVLVLESGGAERSKAAYAAHHLAADAAFQKAARATQLRRVGGASGDLAWVATEGRVQGQSGERIIDRMTTETMLLARTGEGWRIVHVHWSSRAAPKP